MRSDFKDKRMRRIQLRVAHLGKLAKLNNIREYGADAGKFPSDGNLRAGGPVCVGYAGGKNEHVQRMEQVTVYAPRLPEGS